MEVFGMKVGLLTSASIRCFLFTMRFRHVTYYDENYFLLQGMQFMVSVISAKVLVLDLQYF